MASGVAEGADGRQVSFVVWVNYTIVEMLSGPPKEVQGAYLVELEDGSSAEIISEDALRVDGSGEVLRVVSGE